MLKLSIFILCVVIVGLVYVIRKKNMHIWLPAYISGCIRGNPDIDPNSPVHVVFCIVDHFEPAWRNVTRDQEDRRVDRWLNEYPKLALKHRDSEGKHPQYTFFYPEEDYRKEHLDKLAQLCRGGFGNVEIHLHHDNDTAEGLKNKIERFKRILRSHGLLSTDKDGQITYGFIHGNWALDNSRKDGRWCGVNNELTVLRETGCYADFTLPSAPSDTQTAKINSIYYATDDPEKPKSHNKGVDVEVGGKTDGDLLIIQGPLALNWKKRKCGIFPAIENGEITASNPPTRDRVDLWIKQHIHVRGKPNWIFVKVHSHGCQENNMNVLLGKGLDDMFSYLEKRYNDGKRFQLHYVSAYGMYNTIKDLERS